MASVSSDKASKRGQFNRRVMFTPPGETRKAVYLGPVSLRHAQEFARRVELIIGGIISGRIDEDTRRWIEELDAETYAKLATAKLLTARTSSTPTSLGAFIDAYLTGRDDIKGSTKICLGQARRRLVEFFGEARELASISEGDAEEFGRWLSAQVSVNTSRRLCGRAKQFFRFTVRKRVIRTNPFTDLKSNVQSNPDKLFFVTREMADKVTAACPTAEWRLLFALSRYGGLRCPSEHLSLQWADVDWERGRLRVPSPKTEHIEGRASRTIPLFDEIRGPLLEVFEAAEPGETRIIKRAYRGANTNLRTQFQKIVRRAGLEPWPRLFHNLRATRTTELAEILPAHVVEAFIGNTEAVAKKHYLQTTDAHFDKALALGIAPAAQITAQKALETAGTHQKCVGPNLEFSTENAGFGPATGGGSMASIGLEPILLLGNGF